MYIYRLNIKNIFLVFFICKINLKCFDIFDFAKLYSPGILSMDSPLENLLVISYFLLFDSLKTF